MADQNCETTPARGATQGEETPFRALEEGELPPGTPEAFAQGRPADPSPDVQLTDEYPPSEVSVPNVGRQQQDNQSSQGSQGSVGTQGFGTTQMQREMAEQLKAVLGEESADKLKQMSDNDKAAAFMASLVTGMLKMGVEFKELAGEMKKAQTPVKPPPPDPNPVVAPGTHTPKPKPSDPDPNMGELVYHGDVWMVRLGGVPNIHWTGLDAKSKKTGSGQYRSLDKTKGYKTAYQLTPLEPKWKKTAKLTTLQQHLLTVLVKCGMEQHCYLRHPHKPNEMLNVIEHPHLISGNMDYVRREVAWQIARYDGWDEENAENAKQFLLDCVHHFILICFAVLTICNAKSLVSPNR